MTNWSTLHNVVFSTDGDPDVLPLYADPETWTQIGEETVKISENAHIEDVLSRSSMRIRAGRRVSFASYFNAFPASYWQHFSNVRSVRLTLATTGAGTILVYRSNSQGIQQSVTSRPISGSAETVVDLPIQSFGDGGWYWFDIVAENDDVILNRGVWSTQAEPVVNGKVSLGITTFNKPDYCVATLAALEESDELLAEIDRIFIVDQGNQRVADEAAYPELAARLGDQLQVLTQSNLGGSGGFARSMAETLARPESDFVLLLDDDVKVEPESILRALRFARHSRRPTIVGGHMFDLLDRPVMHAFAEVIDPAPFVWQTQFKDSFPHDFRRSNLRQTRMLHARMDSDYNGWWFCLIPTAVIREAGLALPAFIKWDDAEYSLRAREHGFPTVSFPGAALWHVSWIDKDDAIDWQAYFHQRNRFVAALLHSRHKNGGKLLKDSRRADLKHLLSMQYYAVALRHQGLRDVLTGPEHMHRTMPTQLGKLREQARNFREKKVLRSDDETPITNQGKQVYKAPSGTQQTKGPRGIPLVIYTIKMIARHWLSDPSTRDQERPQVELAKRDATWFRAPTFDSALVSTAEGSGKVWYLRDRRTFRRMLRESIRLHREIEKNWDRLAKEYQAALPRITSVDEWQNTFEK
ncbi:glycosyltransferase family 2 protein [Mycetocola manganoxydans]|uniref:Glycosyltransferase family 2 protein n=1 Tax=Mycetocola manganoxydans TaxID=699879 RepID=A0A3L7A1B7_9MICO|nr:glycosyltransferase [Mycetocola manganoxydans]RLP73864.1 glycosyltransferase family 2 protein [Mycetocola manganoxydans]GHD42633.1 glycosyl transferase [Mycetocola manganoxydans]